MSEDDMILMQTLSESEIQSLTVECAATCAPDTGEECFADCYVASGFSAECSACFGVVGACIGANCMDNCGASGSVGACSACMTEFDCEEGFALCSGLF